MLPTCERMMSYAVRYNLKRIQLGRVFYIDIFSEKPSTGKQNSDVREGKAGGRIEKLSIIQQWYLGYWIKTDELFYLQGVDKP